MATRPLRCLAPAGGDRRRRLVELGPGISRMLLGVKAAAARSAPQSSRVVSCMSECLSVLLATGRQRVGGLSGDQ